MSRYRFELADAGRRRRPAARSWRRRRWRAASRVSFRREPSWFDGAPSSTAASARWSPAATCGRGPARRLRLPLGRRRVMSTAGRGSVGYLSSLRLLPEHRNRGLVARGYAFFRQLHARRAARRST